ncbi:MAG: choice-of-anchor J domain-containing protein [Ignavibacteria bacterium]|nr:choice-of-anchor J domain-containing protein [Ignavibacteria bacterium]
MKTKLTIVLFVFVLVFGLLLGFVLEDPYGSKTKVTNETNAVQNSNTIYTDGTPVYTDNFDGANDTTALKSRGYKPYYRGNGPQGSTATWFQGNASVFPAFNGPTSGYVAANYNVVTGANNIDSWLVLPRIAGGILAGDSLYFYSRGPTGSTYPDSFRVMYSVADSVPEGTWTELGRFKANTTTGWEKRGFKAPTTSVNGRFAIRYCVVNGGPSGTNSDYIGIDALTIERTGGGPSLTNPTNMCAYTNAPFTSLWAIGSDVFGDTLYVVGGSTAGSGSTTVRRYNIHSNTMAPDGVPIPESKAGHSFTKCGDALYLIGGGASVSTGGTTCYKYTPSTGTWTSISPMPVGRSGHNAVNWGDSVIFVVGGAWSSYSTIVYAYRPATNTWITSTALPAGTARRSAACGLDNGKIFLSCGYSGAFRNDLVIGTIGANASTITWATGPIVPFLGGKTGTSRPGGTAVNGKFYMITGETTPAPYPHDTIYVFDANTNTWSNIKGGRGGQASSNYWSSVSYKIMSSGNIKIFIPGGSITGGIGQLCCLQVPACTITGIENNAEIPADYQLSQNYPNPFNPTTKISYAIPKAGFVTLKIYDMLGREVANLVNTERQAGTYIVDFDASNLSSGIYFYRISVNEFTDIKKMTLLK